jgi:hypothetical protein
MTTRAVPEMREWDGRPYDGGFDGLHDLAGREFTGAVETADHALFMLRGRVVGVFALDDGTESGLTPADIDAFEDASGTAYEAPHAALPLLFAMQGTGGEERGRYYSEDTPLSEVHERLSGGFTGYVELSENVLSGDYFSVYHGGRAKHAAYVGQSRRLLEDEEAFERACDEVGIYTVTAVDLNTVDIPGEPSGDAAAGVGAGAGSGGSVAGGAAAGAAAGGTATDGDETTRDGTTPEEATADGTATTPEDGTDIGTAVPEIDLGGDDITSATSATGDAEPSGEESDPGEADPAEADAAGSSADAVTDVDEPGDGAADPGDDGAADPEPAADDPDVTAAIRSVEDDSPESNTEPGAEPAASDPAAEGTAPSGADAEPTPAAGEAERLREELAARDREVEELEAEVAELESEAAELRRALQGARDERDDLAARVEDLEGRLRDLGSGDAAPERSLSRGEALSGTSLFVRYGSKGEPTLEELDGGASREAIVGNLRLEQHTEFDADAVAVEGRAFDAFLRDTQEYGVVRWLVMDLPLEIRETGGQGKLGELYAALADIDRISFGETVAFGDDERTFDLVARDRMGDLLVVATLDEAREPADEGRMAEFVRDATAVARAEPSLAGAMVVTAAYFEPEALSTAEEATGGSLLSRDERESFVKLSRNQGYHLCLVEDREESFYLSVPEL